MVTIKRLIQKYGDVQCAIGTMNQMIVEHRQKTAALEQEIQNKKKALKAIKAKINNNSVTQ